MLPVLKKTLQNLKRDRVDILVITGDIVDAPAIIQNGNDYYMDLITPFRETVRKDYRLIRSLLAQSGLPWMIIPGNRDVYDLFDETFGDHPIIMDIRRFRFIGFQDRQWDHKIPRRFDRERRLMETALADDAHPRQIHLQHYLIHKGDKSDREHRYLEWDNIRKMTRDSEKVLLSLSGHYHPGVPSLKEGTTTWYSAKALCRVPHTLTIHELWENGDHSCTEEVVDTDSATAGKPVVFLDRDGVINTRHAYTTGPEEMELIPGSARAIKLLKEAGYAVVVNTNQSCIGLGYVPESVVQLNNEYMCYLMMQETGDPEAQPDAIFYSKGAGKKAIHSSLKDLSLTKPSPALLEKAFSLLQLNREDSWMIGDREGDLLCGRNGRVSPLLVMTGKGEETASLINKGEYPGLVIKRDLLAAAEFIINNRKSRW